MKKLLQKISLVLFKLLRTLLSYVSENNKIKFGKFIGIILKYASTKRRNITEENIRRSNLGYNNSQLSKIITESYQNLGITLVELLTIDKYDFSKANHKVKFSNIKLIKEVKSRGNGVILLSGHYGNWELLAYAASILLKLPLHIVVKYQMNPYTDVYLRNLRIRGGNQLIDMKKAGISLVKLIKKNEIIALLSDQRAGNNEGIELPFLGRQASAYKAPAVLALKFDTPIVVGFAVRDENNNYNVDLVELKHNDLENNDEGIAELTKRYLKLLESAIEDNPGHWAWQHNRWKMN